MEEDIKILEEIVDIYYNCAGNKEQDYDMRVDMGFMKKEAQALENLIKGYRDSENIMEDAVKENLELKKYIRELEEQIDKHVYFETTNPKEIEKNFIPKSKIKEKIEEYKQEMKEIRAKEKGLIWNHRLHKLDYAIQVLQELMEDNYD